MTTKEVFDHHGEAIGKGDVEGILKDYTEKSVLHTPSGPVKGIAGLRKFFTKLVTEVMPPGGTEFEMKRMDVEGECVYIVWKASSRFVDIPFGTDTFVIRDGKIQVQTYAAQEIPKKR